MLGQLWLTLMIMMNGGPVTGVFFVGFQRDLPVVQ
jgi:hypothetical protein